jgi:hypothetical protein
LTSPLTSTDLDTHLPIHQDLSALSLTDPLLSTSFDTESLSLTGYEQYTSLQLQVNYKTTSLWANTITFIILLPDLTTQVSKLLLAILSPSRLFTTTDQDAISADAYDNIQVAIIELL